ERVELVARELAQDEIDLAGVDVFRLELRIDLPVPGLAVWAGERRVFDDDVRRLGVAERHVAQRVGRHQLGDLVLRQRRAAGGRSRGRDDVVAARREADRGEGDD